MPASGSQVIRVGEVAVPALAPGQRVAVRVPVATAALAGRYVLRFAVDPDDLVPELSETNNVAIAPLNVRSEYDLAISAGAIAFGTAPAGKVRITATVRNLGLALPVDVRVAFFKGDPSSATHQIGGGVVRAGTPMNADVAVTIEWDAATASGPTAVHVVVDSDRILNESDKTNNAAFRFYFPGALGPVDLSVQAHEVTTEPSPVRSGSPFTLRALIRNAGPSDASRVAVVVRDATSNVERGRTEVPFVAAGAAVTAEVWAEFSNSVLVTVDPDSALNDSARSNNTAYVPLQVGPAGPNLAAEWLQISETADGSRVSLFFSTGPLAGRSSISLVNALDRSSPPLASVPFSFGVHQYMEVDLGTFKLGSTPMVLRACLDPLDLLAELNENDNCAEQATSNAVADLSIHGRDIAFTPVGAEVGEKVRATITVRNRWRDTAATGIVELWYRAWRSSAGRPSRCGTV